MTSKGLKTVMLFCLENCLSKILFFKSFSKKNAQIVNLKNLDLGFPKKNRTLGHGGIKIHIR